MSNPVDDPSFDTSLESETLAPPAPVGTRLLSTLRRALFEDSAANPIKQAPAVAASLATHVSSNNELENAALTTLRELLSRELSTPAAEFALQVEALSEAIPDLRTRRRAALAVLAKKGVSRAEIQRDLQQALPILAEQQRSFAEKLRLRREEQAAQAARIEHDCALASEAGRQEIERLEALLKAQREAQASAAVERERNLRTLANAGEHLNANELAFSVAYQTIHGEYQTLCEELARLSAERS
ncbi:MAG TPA: hypothetical protein VG937_23930 [Polyangiaceae bacterium]|jgi:hypothetical protein|nr:hypothetical protein [Polyangiaceae bacterium]